MSAPNLPLVAYTRLPINQMQRFTDVRSIVVDQFTNEVRIFHGGFEEQNWARLTKCEYRPRLINTWERFHGLTLYSGDKSCQIKLCLVKFSIVRYPLDADLVYHTLLGIVYP